MDEFTTEQKEWVMSEFMDECSVECISSMAQIRIPHAMTKSDIEEIIRDELKGMKNDG